MARQKTSRLIDIVAEKRHETKEAFLIFDGDKAVWIAKSLVEENDDGTFTMLEWLATEKGLI